MKTQNKYLQHFNKNNIKFDTEQYRIIEVMANYFEKIEKYLLNYTSDNFIKKLFKKNTALPKSIYLYGNVGSGKTVITRTFFDYLPIDKKKCYHFHEFMQMIHKTLYKMRTNMAVKNNNLIADIAKEIAIHSRIIYLDEMTINDIADAMMIGKLLKELINNKVIILITSNLHPNMLYPDGIQRQSFLPTIDFITQHFELLNLLTKQDYRYLKSLSIRSFFEVKNQQQIDIILKQLELELEIGEISALPLSINGRELICTRTFKNIAEFSFDELFNSPLSDADFLALCNSFDIIIITGAKALGPDERNEVRRLINFIDIAYTQKIKLFLISYCKLREIYQNGTLFFEFERTLSRLSEMLTDK